MSGAAAARVAASARSRNGRRESTRLASWIGRLSNRSLSRPDSGSTVSGGGAFAVPGSTASPSTGRTPGKSFMWVVETANLLIDEEPEPADYQVTAPGQLRTPRDPARDPPPGAFGGSLGGRQVLPVERAAALQALRELSNRSLDITGGDGSVHRGAGSTPAEAFVGGAHDTPNVTPSPLPGVAGPHGGEARWCRTAQATLAAAGQSHGSVAFKRHQLDHHVTEVAIEDDSAAGAADTAAGSADGGHEQGPAPPVTGELPEGANAELPKTSSLYSVVQGPEKLTDPGYAFFAAAVRHHVLLQGVAVLLAMCTVPAILLMSWCHFRYLDYWAATGVNVTMHPTAHIMTEGVFEDELLLGVFGTTSTLGSIAAAFSLPGMWLLVLGNWRAPRGFWVVCGVYLVFFFAYTFGCFVAASDGAKIPHSLYGGIAFVVSIALGVVQGQTVRDYLGFPDIWKPLLAQLVIYGSMIFVYNVTIPRWFLDPNTTTSQLVLIRVVIHPMLMELLQTSIRVLTLAYPDHLKESTMIVFLFPVYVMLSLMGRFLVASLPSFGGVVLMSIGLAALSTLLRITMGLRDYLFLRLFCRSSKEAKRLVFSRRRRRMKADIFTLDIVSESFGILAGSLIVWVYSVRAQAGEASQSWVELVLSVAIQIGIALAGDLVPPLAVFLGRERLGSHAPIRIEVAAATSVAVARAQELFMETLAVQTVRTSSTGPQAHGQGGRRGDDLYIYPSAVGHGSSHPVESRALEHHDGSPPATPDGSDEEAVTCDGQDGMELAESLRLGHRPPATSRSSGFSIAMSGGDVDSSGHVASARNVGDAAVATDSKAAASGERPFLSPPRSDQAEERPAIAGDPMSQPRKAALAPLPSSGPRTEELGDDIAPTDDGAPTDASASAGGQQRRRGRTFSFEDGGGSSPLVEARPAVDVLPEEGRVRSSSGRVVPVTRAAATPSSQRSAGRTPGSTRSSPGVRSSSGTAAALGLRLDTSSGHSGNGGTTAKSISDSGFAPDSPTAPRASDSKGADVGSERTVGPIDESPSLQQSQSWKAERGYVRATLAAPGAATPGRDDASAEGESKAVAVVRDWPRPRAPKKIGFVTNMFLRLSRSQVNLLNVWFGASHSARIDTNTP